MLFNIDLLRSDWWNCGRTRWVAVVTVAVLTVILGFGRRLIECVWFLVYATTCRAETKLISGFN